MTKFLQLLARLLMPEKPIATPSEPTASPPVVVTPPQQSDGVPQGEPSGAYTPPFPDDFAGITKFRNSRDCRAWPVTATVGSVSIRGGNIYWSEDAARDNKWNRMSSKGKICNGEALLIIPSIGTAGMFDFLKVGQRNKILSNVPEFFHGWVPKKGERVGFLIATISRNAAHAKMRERSNVVWITWPRDGF